MNSANPSIATSSNGKISKLAPSKRALFFSTYRRNQAWAFPKPIIEYIAKNPLSPKVYEKLIKSSKYFFVKNPLLVVERFFAKYEEGEWHNYFNDDQPVDLQNITSKIWVTDELAIGDVEGGAGHPFTFSSLFSKLHKNYVECFSLTYQNIVLDDLILLASKCEEINLYMVTVKDENDAVVTLDKIIEVLPNVKEFYYDLEDMPADIITTDTVQKLIQIPHFCNLSYFCLSDVPDSFDIDAFYSYIKKNKQTEIHLHFGHHQNRLQELVNEIIQTEEHDYMVPFITFLGVDEASLKKLYRFYKQN